MWVAFEDETAPKGERARGALIVPSPTADFDTAAAAAVCCLAAHRRAIEFSDYTVHIAEIDTDEHGLPQADWVNRPLTNDEATSIANAWTGGVASPAQIRDAFADDTARPGDPLFRPEGT